MKLFKVQPLIIMMIFNILTSYSHKFSFPYFEDYYSMLETDPMVKVI